MLRSGKYKLRHVWIDKSTRGDYEDKTKIIRLNLYVEIARTIIHELRHAEVAGEGWVPIAPDDEERAVIGYECNRFRHLSAQSIKAIAREVLKQMGGVI